MSTKLSKRSAWIKSHNLIAALLCGGLGARQQRYDQKDAERYITESEKAWAKLAAIGDKSVIERILAGDFAGVDTKRPALRQSENGCGNRGPAKVFRFYGDSAIAQGNESWSERRVNAAVCLDRHVSSPEWTVANCCDRNLSAPEPAGSPSPQII